MFLFSFLSRSKLFTQISSRISVPSRSFSTGGTGDIRGAGGAFGKKEKAQEEQYFRQKEKEELAELKKKIDEKTEKKTESEFADKKQKKK